MSSNRPDLTDDTPSGTLSSEWYFVRPWTPYLTLSIREITSVSATFILSSSFVDARDPSLSALGISSSEEEDNDSNDFHQIDIFGHRSTVIADALAKGLSVDVNGSPWKKVFIRMDDQVDEAVIIIYGLMPGRQYDIDLGLVQRGQNSNIRKQVVTEDFDHSGAHPDREKEVTNFATPAPESLISPSTSNHIPEGLSDISAQSNAIHSGPLAMEEKVRQLQLSLSALVAERDALTVSLKAARREAQKADAALRSEIEILKRASEKHVAAEHRTKQKVLSLHEAVKRAQAVAKEVDELVAEAEESLPDLRQQVDSKETEYARVKAEADRVQEERVKEDEEDRKRLESMKGELMGLGHRLEKVHAKRERLEANVIPELEVQLQELTREIERVESGQYQRLSVQSTDVKAEDVNGPVLDLPFDQAYEGPHVPANRKRHHSHNHPGPIGRPAAVPLQRSSHNQPSSSPHQRPVGHHSNPMTFRNNIPPHPHPHLQTPIQPLNSQIPVSSPMHLLNSTGTSSSSESSSPSSIPSITLSSKAAPFDPTHGVSQTLRVSMSADTPQVLPPIQRPSPPAHGKGSSRFIRIVHSQESNRSRERKQSSDS